METIIRRWSNYQEDSLRRFFSKIEVRADGCWTWMASLNNKGYANFFFAGKHWLGHRWAYVYLRRRRIPPRKEMDHIVCDFPACVNPYHVTPTTHKKNLSRSEKCAANAVRVGQLTAARKKLITHCPKGHEYTPENTWRNERGHRWCRTCNRLKHRKVV